MIQIEFSDEERLILKSLLENCLADLRMEIIQTDNINYKIMLKKRKTILLKLQKTLVEMPNSPERVVQ